MTIEDITRTPPPSSLQPITLTHSSGKPHVANTAQVTVLLTRLPCRDRDHCSETLTSNDSPLCFILLLSDAEATTQSRSPSQTGHQASLDIKVTGWPYRVRKLHQGLARL